MNDLIGNQINHWIDYHLFFQNSLKGQKILSRENKDPWEHKNFNAILLKK